MAKGRYIGRGGLVGYGAKVQVTAVTSTATKLPNSGTVSFGSTAARTWLLRLPETIGQRVTLYCNAAAGGAVQTVDTTGGNVFQTAEGQVATLKFTQPYQSLELIALSTALYQVVDNNLQYPLTTVTSTAVTLPSWGVVVFGSTAAKTFLLADPQKGREVVLLQNSGSTLVRKAKLSSTGHQFYTTAGAAGRVAQFTRQYQYLRLVGQSSVIYRVLDKSAGPTYAAS